MLFDRQRAVLMAAVFFATVGYGVSFPLLAILLDSMQVSGGLIGLNAAMPAVGWIIASLMMPQLHKRFSTRSIVFAFLLIALLGLIGFSLSSDYWFWLFCRLLFGGGLGMFFRTIEYHLNASVNSERRGQLFGIYMSTFLAGIIVGSLVQPALGSEGLLPFVSILICLIASAICIFGSGIQSVSELDTAAQSYITLRTLKFLWMSVPIAVAAIFVYGLVESIPAYFMPIYALKLGFSEAQAAYTLSAVALGNILFAFPIGLLSDKIGRYPVICACAVIGVVCYGFVPFSMSSFPLFLILLVIIGGCVVGVYSTSLAIIGDQSDASDLIYANATFGILYAVGSLVGPIVHGLSMQAVEPHGMIISAVTIFVFFLLFAAKNNPQQSKVK